MVAEALNIAIRTKKFNMIKIYDKSVIYLMCPPRFATGGPELMHQLAHKLSMAGMNAKMFYYPQVENPVHEDYRVYGTEYTESIDDNSKNVLIIPEVMVPDVNSMTNLRQIRKCVWWLSVDGFFKKVHSTKIYKGLKLLLPSSKFPFFEDRYFNKHIVQSSYAFHLVQSRYAYNFLTNRGIHSTYLSDYLNSTFIESSTKVDLTKKSDIVLYNPKKGYQFTKALISQSPELNWIPIVNLKPIQVSELLGRAKVYVDFGHHPGKDRFPREAAILSCCIITGRRGSAFNDEDVPIARKYKIDDRAKNIPDVISLIKDVLTNYQTHVLNFDSYRKKIINEEAEFIGDVKRVFVID